MPDSDDDKIPSQHSEVNEIDEFKSGRNLLATAVVAGHAVKHIFNSGLLSVLLPKAKLSLPIGMGLNGAQFGTLLTARNVTSWGTTIGAGYLGDRFSHRAPLLISFSLATLGIAFFLAGWTRDYWIMFGAMLVAGMGPSLYHPPALGELSRRFPDRRGFAISLHGAGGSVGEVLGPVVVWIALITMTWRGVLQASLVPALLAALIIWWVMRSSPVKISDTASSRAYFTSIVDLLSNPTILLIVLIAAVRMAGEIAISGFLPVYLLEYLEFSDFRLAVYLAGSQIMGIVAQPVMGHLSDLYGRKVVLIPGLMAASCIAMLFVVADTGWQLAIVVLARGAFAFPIHHMLIAAAIDIARGQVQSTVVSLIYGAGFLASFSPAIAGMFVDEYGIRSAFLYGGIMIMIAPIMMLKLKIPTGR